MKYKTWKRVPKFMKKRFEQHNKEREGVKPGAVTDFAWVTVKNKDGKPESVSINKCGTDICHAGLRRGTKGKDFIFDRIQWLCQRDNLGQDIRKRQPKEKIIRLIDFMINRSYMRHAYPVKDAEYLFKHNCFILSCHVNRNYLAHACTAGRIFGENAHVADLWIEMVDQGVSEEFAWYAAVLLKKNGGQYLAGTRYGHIHMHCRAGGKKLLQYMDFAESKYVFQETYHDEATYQFICGFTNNFGDYHNIEAYGGNGVGQMNDLIDRFNTENQREGVAKEAPRLLKVTSIDEYFGIRPNEKALKKEDLVAFEPYFWGLNEKEIKLGQAA